MIAFDSIYTITSFSPNTLTLSAWAALERKVYLREEVGEVQQLPKEDVEYIELAPTMMPNE